VVDGCPPRVPLTAEPVQFELNRRRPGQNRLVTPRNESDAVEILSGVDVESGVTLGTPIAMLVRNKDQKSNDYDTMARGRRRFFDGARWFPRRAVMVSSARVEATGFP